MRSLVLLPSKNLFWLWHTRIPESAALADYVADSIAKNKLLYSIDEPILIPMFNAYCWSATLQQERRRAIIKTNTKLYACARKRTFRKTFVEAGILVDQGEVLFAINYKKGDLPFC